MKLWLFMPERLDRKQGAMPKINWNKNGKINQCMGNTKKSKGKRCGPSNDQPMTEDSCAQVRNRPWLYYYCLRSGHQDQLLSLQDPKRWHRPNVQDLWSISGNYSPYCGRVPCDHELANTEYLHTHTTKPPYSYLHWHLQRYDDDIIWYDDDMIHKGEKVWAWAPNSNKTTSKSCGKCRYKQILRERPKTRHCNQEQTRNKLPAHWYVHPHWKEHFS